MCDHRGEPVKVGRFTVLAGGMQYMEPKDLKKADILVPLLERTPLPLGEEFHVLSGALKDFGGVPENWEDFLRTVIKKLRRRKKILAFCMASHGRTGTFLASLIALLESPKETPDPIAAVRERHCPHAVETLAQAEAIFALRGEKLPEQYATTLL